MRVKFYFKRERKEMLQGYLSGKYESLGEWTVKINFRDEIEPRRKIRQSILIPCPIRCQ